MAENLSRAASSLIDEKQVAELLAARWPGGTTTDTAILRAEIRMMLDQHARKGALGPALAEVYRAGWAAGEVAAGEAIGRAQATVKPKAVPLNPPKLHHQPTPGLG